MLELARVLVPGGLAMVAFHVGNDAPHIEELFGIATSLDFFFHPVDEVETAARDAGLEHRATLLREPFAGAEH